MPLVRQFGEVPHGFHGSGIRAIAYDGTGRFLLAASEKALRLWTAATLERVATLAEDRVSGVIGFVGEHAVAVVGRQIRFWRLPDAERAGEIELEPDEGGRPPSVVLSPGGVAAVRRETHVEVWDLVTRERRAGGPAIEWPPHVQLRGGMALTRDGHRLLVYTDRRVDVWDLPGQRRVASVERQLSENAMMPLGDGLHALSHRLSDSRGNVLPYVQRNGRPVVDEVDLGAGGRLVRRFQGPFERFVEGRDGALAAATHASLSFWRPGAANAVVADRRADLPVGGRITALALSPDASVLACGDSDGWLTRWDAPTLRPLDRRTAMSPARVAQPRGASVAVVALGASGDGRRVLAVQENGDGIVWDLERGEAVARATVGDRVLGAAGLAEDAGFATLHDERETRHPHEGGFRCRIWSPALAPIGELRTGAVVSLARDGSGRLAVATGARVEVLALPALESRLAFECEQPVLALSLSPDARALAYAFATPIPTTTTTPRVRNSVGVVEVPSGRVLFRCELPGFERPVGALALSALPHLCAVSGVLYDLEANTTRNGLSATGGFHVFGPAGARYAITGSDLPTMWIHDVSPGSAPRAEDPRLEHGARVRSACWLGPTRVAIGGEDGTFTVWSLPE